MKENKKLNNMNLDDKQTTRLLKLGLSDSDIPACKDLESYRKECLSDLLNSKLPVDEIFTKMLPFFIKSLSEELVTISGFSLRDCLTNPEIKLAILIRIKDYTKNLGKTSDNKIKREVSKIIYFAAVAAALVFHENKISEYPYKYLLRSFKFCRQKDWIPKELIDIFDIAIGECEKKEDII